MKDKKGKRERMKDKKGKREREWKKKKNIKIENNSKQQNADKPWALTMLPIILLNPPIVFI